MIIAIPPGDQNRIEIIGKSQGYLGLPVHFGQTHDTPDGRHAPKLTTAWQPTPEEIARIVAGACIQVELLNVVQHPPIMVSVGAVPEL